LQRSQIRFFEADKISSTGSPQV